MKQISATLAAVSAIRLASKTTAEEEVITGVVNFDGMDFDWALDVDVDYGHEDYGREHHGHDDHDRHGDSGPVRTVDPVCDAASDFLMELGTSLDTDNSGTIELSEVDDFLRPFVSMESPDQLPPAVMGLWENLDTNKDGTF